jgi:hypothetical protein
LIVCSVLSLFICAVGGGLFFATGIPQAANQLQEQKKRARNKGLNITYAAYLQERNIPDSDNAGFTLKPFLKGVEAIKKPKNSKPADLGTIEEYQAMVPLLPILEEAKKKPQCNFTQPSTSAITLLFPELATLKKAVKILVGRAKIASEKGDLVMAKKCYEDALYINSISDGSDTLIGELVQIATSSIIFNEIRNCLQLHQSQSNWIQMIKGIVEKIDDRPDLIQCLRTEHMMCIDVIENIRKDPKFLGEISMMESSDAVFKLVMKLPRGLDANESRIHERYTDLVGNLPKDEYNYLASERELAKLDNIGSERDLSYVLSRVLFPVFTQVAFAMHKRSATRTVLQESIAYLEGKNPTLNSTTLTGNRYLDLDGNAIRIKKDQPGEVWFYSISSNKVDDDGENNTMSVPKKDDFTVKLKRR